MKKILEELNTILAAAFVRAGFDASYGRVNVSSRPDLCEFQCNGAMACAKAAKQKPIDIAEKVAAELQKERVFSKVETCMPGFINMDASAAWMSERLSEMAGDETLGLSAPEKAETIIVDYGGANVAKPLHVGHLRSAVIGEAVKRMGKRMGYEMIGDVHLGDWGLQMGLIIEELKDRGMESFTLSDLEEIYPAASAKSKEKDEATGELTEAAKAFKERALTATGLLQNGDPYCRKIWERIMDLSVADLKKNYDRLNVSFELWKGESDAQKYIPDMIKDMEERGIAYTSNGALVVDVQEETDTKELPPCLIRKSDGASLYATTDLATMVEREALYQPDSYIYIADQRQNLHYTSFFRVAKKAGIVKPETKLTFLGFGTMNGKDGKPFKTREGGVMRLELLIGDINEKVYEKIRETRSEAEIPEAEAREIARIVGLAALKYGDLSNQAVKDYIFDIDRFTSFEGNTGPYILYTIVRITSILNKYYGTENVKALEKKLSEEGVSEGGRSEGSADIYVKAAQQAASGKALGLLLARYNDVAEQAWKDIAPHKLCQYIYEISNAFNSFYHDVKILGEEDAEKKESYIALLSLCRRVLLSCIDMLGFEAPERM